MITLYLVRHCEYDLSHGGLPGRLPVELSHHGMAQATLLRRYFKEKGIDRIYSSIVRRCQQTSEMISDKIIPISYDERLLETLSAYQGFWYTGEKDREYFYGLRKFLGGETYEQVYTRVAAFWDEISKKDGTFVICSHGDPLFLMYLHSLGITCPDDSSIKVILQEHTYPLKGSTRKGTCDGSGAWTWEEIVQF